MHDLVTKKWSYQVLNRYPFKKKISFEPLMFVFPHVYFLRIEMETATFSSNGKDPDT